MKHACPAHSLAAKISTPPTSSRSAGIIWQQNGQRWRQAGDWSPEDPSVEGPRVLTLRGRTPSPGELERSVSKAPFPELEALNQGDKSPGAANGDVHLG